MSEENVQAGAEQAPEVNINDERAIRRARRQAMIDDGIDPYPPHSHIDAYAADIIAQHEGLEAVFEFYYI